MKKEFVTLGAAAAAAVVAVGFFVMSKGSEEKKLSFSQMSEIKSSASRIGTYLGMLGACLNDEKLGNALGTESIAGMWDPSKTLTVDQVKSKVITAMEESGLGNDDLSEIDNIIRDRQNEVQQGASADIAVNFEAGLNICIAVMSQTAVFEKKTILPDDPIERINVFAKISPLSQ